MAINTNFKTFTTGYRPYDDFANKYGIRSINVNRDRREIDYYNVKASYYADREETLDIEMNRRTFEHLVHVDEEYTRMWQNQRDEMYMRKEYPAIKEAYEKYRMLLELYR